MTAPDVVSYAKKYFNCATAWGVPLENGGGSGSQGAHWERTALGNEGMTGSPIGDRVFSEFTFNLYLASGWYLPNFTMAQPLAWGRNEGCNMIQSDCNHQAEEVCNLSAPDAGDGCSFDFSGTGKCAANDQFSKTCPYWVGYSNTKCENAKDWDQVWKIAGGASSQWSRCWVTDLFKKRGYSYNAGCFISFCNFTSTGAIAYIKIQDAWFRCNQKGRINVTGGTVNCPDPNHFCLEEGTCPNSCSARGTCKWGKCYCYPGFGGTDCSKTA